MSDEILAELRRLTERVDRLDDIAAESEAAYDAARAELEDAEADLRAARRVALTTCRAAGVALHLLACSRDAWTVQVHDGWALTDGHALLWAAGATRPDAVQKGWLCGRQGPTSKSVERLLEPWREAPVIAYADRKALVAACESADDPRDPRPYLTHRGTQIQADLVAEWVIPASAGDVPIIAWPRATTKEEREPLICGVPGRWIGIVMPLMWTGDKVERRIVPWPDTAT